MACFLVQISEEGRFVLRTAEAMKEEQEKEKSGEARPVDDSFNTTAFDMTQASRFVNVLFAVLSKANAFCILRFNNQKNSTDCDFYRL